MFQFARIMVDTQVAQGTNPFAFMAYFFIAIGAYVLYCAFTGKGQVYKNEYPAEIQDSVKRMTKILCYYEGPVLIASGIFDLTPGLPPILGTVFMGLGFLGVVGYVVWLYRTHGKVIRTKKEKF